MYTRSQNRGVHCSTIYSSEKPQITTCPGSLGGLDGEESACNAGAPGLIPG